ncbi:putative GDSL-like lipase/acylhydrolase [Actinoplanes missouriensis 431]|uniref:Putative GDSL-like lipase/acylhydrolase n=1 Tax=Actinoplanes missouriensis (strain ATCC 14538 / DSM 43046 / CBS 188.64 / JCM 3121 / NBRC 102363 / NCIMB 12654 / NRRL B-3342 / UNCC 431) TaxID=512565 RepID=I0HFC3_ACTM4|nr:SGNH/GDSL hydrolase family protein [Actinoplanes missouriensis]BAL91710.1 putative GDSL-like lipase/acylhydrolase [Actinoplanes missouriensis 431]
MRAATVLASLVTSALSLVLLAAPAQAASTVDYVALGDSYSSGVGAPGQSGTCLRSNNSYAAQWAARNSPASFQFLACGGAVTDDIVNTQAPAMRSGADLVSITIGGNDAGFAPTVITCLTSSDSTCAAKVESGKAYVRNTLPGKLDAAYRAIRAKAPDARVVVLSYPLIFDTSSLFCEMSVAKRRSLNSGAQALDDMIRSRAEAIGFVYSEVRDEFSGHGVCSSRPYLNGLTVIPPQNSYHPNTNGYTYGYLPALTSSAS